MASLGFTWFHLVSLGFTCSHVVSLGFTWFHLVSLGITWYHLVSLGSHLDSLGLTWTHLTHSGSLGLTWIHLDSLDSLDPPREKGKPAGGKGKREKARNEISGLDLTRHTVCARATNETKRFPGWTHPPNLRYSSRLTCSG